MRIFDQQDEARSWSWRLGVMFALAVAATVLGVHLAARLAWGLVGLGMQVPAWFLPINIGLPLLMVLGGWWIEHGNMASPGGMQRLARRLGARELWASSRPAEQRLANIVEEVCIAAHMPRPQVMVLPRMQSINALAAGLQAHDAVVMVSQGALDWLTRDELQGLVAHECSHIHEGDTRLNMQLAGMVAGLEMIWRLGDDLREVQLPFTRVVGPLVMGVGIFGWWAGRLLQAMFSRQRELLADARAVQWTRSRDGLGGVLRKALAQRQQPGGLPREPALHPAFRHLLLLGAAGERGGWLDAHPPLAERIRRIYGRPMGPLPLSAPTPARPEPVEGLGGSGQGFDKLSPNGFSQSS